MTQGDRIKKLMALLAIAFYWTHKVGKWHAEKKSIPFIRFRQSIWPQHSLFRYGFDFLRKLILNADAADKHFQHV